MAKLSKNKLNKLLQEALSTYGIEVYPKLLPKISSYIVDNYTKVTLSASEYIEHGLFIQYLNEERLKQNRYIAIKEIKKGTSQFTFIENLLPTINRYTELFYEGNKDLGYPSYIRIGLQLMGKHYRLQNFQYKEDDIFQQRHHVKEVLEDKTPDETIRMRESWCQAITQKYGACTDHNITSESPSSYINFIWAKQQCNKLKIPYLTWCKAQVDRLSFIGKPMLGSIHGQKALDRYNQYSKDVGKKAGTTKATIIDKIQAHLDDQQKHNNANRVKK